MLDSIVLKFGSDSTPLAFSPGPLTIFVGPNNSGKSLILREIEGTLQYPNSLANKIIDTLKTKFAANKMAIEPFIERRRYVPADANFPLDTYYLGRLNFLTKKQENAHPHTASSITHQKTQTDFMNYLVYLYSIRIDGSTRLNLLNASETSDLQMLPQNIGMLLLKNIERREFIRGIIYDAFGLYMSTDITGLRSIRINYSYELPDEEIETSVSQKAWQYHSNAVRYEDVGDGVKAYSGIITSIAASDNKLLLIDEPEAFLHPPLARKLGIDIVTISRDIDSNVFISTHSSDFLLGILQSNLPVNIIRLTNDKSNPSATILSNEEIRELTRNPVMRSSNVLSALFHKGAIVSEDDSDRVLYQEINHRLIEHGEKGLQGSIFLNSNGKSAMHKIIRPLRKCGVPAAACVDFDFIFQGADFGNFLNAANVPQGASQGLKSQREILLRSIPEADMSQVKSSGLSYFSGNSKNDAVDLLEKLASYGIFVVNNGEVESWLPSLNPSGKKVGRIMDLLSKMGDNPEDGAYLRPASGDIWDYLRAISQWIDNPHRKGMP